MKGKQKILMVFSEVSPFTMTCGSGEVGGGLPKALKDLGHDVRVITPQYRIINERKYILRDVIRLQNIEVPFGNKTLIINVKSAFLPNSKVQVYFIDYKSYFFREGLYVNPENGKEYPDNDKRFILFSRGVLETLKKLQWQPDVIHCNDWQTGLIPFFLKTNYKDDSFFTKICTLLTVHNFTSQGIFDPVCISDMGLDGNFCFSGSSLEFNNKCNFLHTGLNYADLINTVSESYSKEVQSSSEFGYGMENVLQKRKNDFFGIVNGVDYGVWNPEVDYWIPERYGPGNLDGKIKAKKALLEKHGLLYDEKIPVVVLNSPLTDQNGMNLIKDSFDQMMNLNIYFILLGFGEKAYHQFFKQIKKKYANKVGINFTYDDSLAHLVTAGADIVLIPSNYEPCGLVQLTGLKYGAVPLVRKTGGLADTIKPFNKEFGTGTGFVFKEDNVNHFIKTLKGSLKVFNDQKVWIRLMKNGMREDFSWNTSAKKYVQLYNKCILKKK
jgi:starch synthase